MTSTRARARPAVLAVACALPGALALAPGLPLSVEPAVAFRPGCASYGAGVSIERPTPLAALAAAPEDWDGETVRVEGEVREVCAMAGCWLAIAAEDGGPPLRVKVEDGQIVFPLSARGQRAAAEREVVVIDSARGQHVAWPTTKPCRYCATTIPVAATRCPQCTSELAAAVGG